MHDDDDVNDDDDTDDDVNDDDDDDDADEGANTQSHFIHSQNVFLNYSLSFVATSNCSNCSVVFQTSGSGAGAVGLYGVSVCTFCVTVANAGFDNNASVVSWACAS